MKETPSMDAPCIYVGMYCPFYCDVFFVLLFTSFAVYIAHHGLHMAPQWWSVLTPWPNRVRGHDPTTTIPTTTTIDTAAIATMAAAAAAARPTSRSKGSGKRPSPAAQPCSIQARPRRVGGGRPGTTGTRRAPLPPPRL